jgi:glutathione synthase/RimK-type ligase-like ATP-grasp enzyme|tara:strand:+ start:720 stop:992 length:273 start_codon:yes stop_codon:yes gene_type:complete
LRGGRYVMEFTSCVVAWLEQHGRRVVNGSNAMLLEMSKVKQELAMQMSGVPTPWTFAAPNKRQVMEAVHKIAADGSSFLLKHNRGGSGGG